MSNLELDAWLWAHVMHGEMQDYSTDRAAALEVLKKCAEKTKKAVCVCICPEGFEVYLGGGDYGKSTVRAATLELTIAKFAYKLWGGKE